jgi:hypothetical protein
MSEHSPSGSHRSEPEQWTEKLDRRPSISSSIDSPVEQQDAPYGNDDKILTPQISRASQPSLALRTISIATNDPDFEVDWEDEKDPANPRNWSLAYRAMCIVFLSWNTLVMCVMRLSAFEDC